MSSEKCHVTAEVIFRIGRVKDPVKSFGAVVERACRELCFDIVRYYFEADPIPLYKGREVPCLVFQVSSWRTVCSHEEWWAVQLQFGTLVKSITENKYPNKPVSSRLSFSPWQLPYLEALLKEFKAIRNQHDQ